jgi:hypothetical protein
VAKTAKSTGVTGAPGLAAQLGTSPATRRRTWQVADVDVRDSHSGRLGPGCCSSATWMLESAIVHTDQHRAPDGYA